jgi:hypothetical protein
MGMIFYLDLHMNQLFGWERVKSKEYVDSIIDGIKRGAVFPSVPVHRTIDNKFYLSLNVKKEGSSTVDGGHNRAIAHYITRKPLKVELLDDLPKNLDEPFLYIPIKDIHPC